MPEHCNGVERTALAGNEDIRGAVPEKLHSLRSLSECRGTDVVLVPSRILLAPFSSMRCDELQWCVGAWLYGVIDCCIAIPSPHRWGTFTVAHMAYCGAQSEFLVFLHIVLSAFRMVAS